MTTPYLFAVMCHFATFIPIVAFSQDAESSSRLADETEVQRLYREAYESASAVWQEIHDSDADILDVRWNYQGSPERLPTHIGNEMSAKLQPAINTLREAWALGDPEFVTDANRADMWQTNNRHVQMMRSLTAEVIQDVAWRVYNGKTANVGSDMANLLQMGDYLSREKTVMASLVNFSVDAFVITQLEQSTIAAGALWPRDAALVLEQLENNHSLDEYGLIAAWDEDRKLMTDSLLEMASDTAKRDAFLQQQVQAWTNSGNSDPLDLAMIERVRAMSPDEMANAAMQYDASQAEFVQLMQIEDSVIARREIDKLNKAIADGRYGPLARMIASQYNPLESFNDLVSMRNNVTSQLRSIANDPDGRAKNMNAAYFYRKAFGQRDRIDDTVWQELEQLADVTWPMQPSLPWWQARRTERLESHAELYELEYDELNDAIEAVMTELLKAAEVEQCQFLDWSERTFRRYLNGDAVYINPMLEYATIAFASYQQASDDHRGNERRSNAVVALTAMANHLAQQSDLLASDLGLHIIKTMTARDMFDEYADLDIVHEILQRFDQHDPLGYDEVMQISAAAPVKLFQRYYEDNPADALKRLKHSHRTTPPVSADLFEGMTHEMQAMSSKVFIVKMTHLSQKLQVQMELLRTAEDQAATESLRSQFHQRLDGDPGLQRVSSWFRYFADPLFHAADQQFTATKQWQAIQEN